LLRRWVDARFRGLEHVQRYSFDRVCVFSLVSFIFLKKTIGESIQQKHGFAKSTGGSMHVSVAFDMFSDMCSIMSGFFSLVSFIFLKNAAGESIQTNQKHVFQIPPGGRWNFPWPRICSTVQRYLLVRWSGRWSQLQVRVVVAERPWADDSAGVPWARAHTRFAQTSATRPWCRTLVGKFPVHRNRGAKFCLGFACRKPSLTSFCAKARLT
jgi:hypothetical protein